MLFSNKKSLIYIKRNALEIFHGEEKFELIIPVTILQNLEIIDSENFKKLLRGFLSNLKIKKQGAIIVLSDEVIFQKEVVAKDENDLNEKYRIFKDALPISFEKVAIKKITFGERVLFLGANKKIFQETAAILKDNEWDISAVIPVALFTDKLGMEGSELTSSLVGKILSEKDLIKICDFLSETQEGKVIKKSFNFKLTALLVFILLLIVILSTLLAVRLKLIGMPGLGSKNNQQKVVEKIESTPSASENEALPSTILRIEISIQFLNGSVIAGQAAKVRDSLAKLGYINTETGNASITETEKTTIIFSKNVNQNYRDEISKKLEEDFTEVEVQDDSTDGEFDVVITTGTEIQTSQ